VNGTGATTPMRPGTPIGAFSPRASRVKGGDVGTVGFTNGVG
jgi:nucleoprotein TPR